MNAPFSSAATPPKPATVNGDLANLPEVFKPYQDRKVWLCWKWVYKPAKKKWDKPPYMTDGKRNAKSTDPATWCTHEQALAAVQSAKVDGIGLALHGLNDREIALDLDDCRDPVSGKIAPWAQEIVDAANSYSEVTVSGTGLRILGLGAIGHQHTNFECGGGRVEVFTAGAGRYITVSGHRLTSCWPGFYDIGNLTKRLLENKGRLHPLEPGGEPEAQPAQRQTAPKLDIGLRQEKERSPYFRNVNSAALAHLDKWVPEILPKAKHYAGQNSWRVSSRDLDRDLEEDLSIHPHGITDWGPRKGLTAIDLVIEFGGAPDALRAADWLCDRCGLDPASLGKKTRQAGEAAQAPTGAQDAPQQPDNTPRHLIPFGDFVQSLQPPDYLIDNILQRGWLYALTAKTGSGKTAVALDLAIRVAEGRALGTLQTTQGPVVYLSGENPEDVKARCLMLAHHHGVTDPAIHFLEGAIRLEAHIDWLIRQIEEAGGASLVIVDTAASYFAGDDENSNTELGEYARLFRRLCKMDCRPTVLVLAHPTKNPSKENLVPRGGGAFLNEVDGNLTLWTEDKEITTLHWQGKFRGPDFEPIQFRLKIVKHDDYIDSRGRALPSVIALPIDFTQAETIEAETRKAEDRVLLSFDDHPDLSVRDRARTLGFVADNGTPLKGRVERIVAQLVQLRLLAKGRKKYRLTPEGEREIAELRGAQPRKKAA